MPEHKLMVRYAQLDENIGGHVADSIEIHPRSRGILFLPGAYSVTRRPPGHRVRLVSAAPDGHGLSAEMIQRGDSERYSVSYDVTNTRDSIAFAHLLWTEQPASAEESQ